MTIFSQVPWHFNHPSRPPGRRKKRILPDWTKLGEIPSGDPLKTDKIVKSFRKTEKYRKLPVKSMKACVLRKMDMVKSLENNVFCFKITFCNIYTTLTSGI